MKVFIINVVCGKGSTGHIVVDLYNEILASGNEACIGYGRGNAPQNVQNYRIGSEMDVLIHAGLSRLTDRQGRYSKRATKALLHKIEAYSPDIIHLHNIHGYYINYEMLFNFLRKYDRPVLWTMHDCWAFTGHCAHYEGVMCDGWSKGCGSCKYSSVYPKAYMGRNTGDNFSKKKSAFLIPNLMIVTPSHWLKTQISQSFFRNVPCTIINNGIDLNKFHIVPSDIKEQLGISGKKMVLGVASVWTNYKGLADFIVLSKRLGSSYAVCMVGLGKKQLKGLPDNMIGIERTESLEMLVKYYSAADVFVNLTYEDTFPTTNIEALACGTPVVTYQSGGSPEIVEGTCGKIIARGNLDAVVHTIVDEIQEKETYKDSCLRRAGMFRKEDCYRQYMMLYRKIIGEI